MMPKRSKALISTDREVAAAKCPAEGRVVAEYRIAGTPNLVLRVTASGYRSSTYWLKRPKISRWQKYPLGPYPALTLARARDQAVRLRGAILDGEDPFDKRAAGRGILSLRALGDIFIVRYAKPKKRSWAEDERKLKVDVYPVLGDVRADLVTKLDIVRLLDGIHDRGAPIHANRTLSLVRKLLNWGVAEGYIAANPAVGIPMRAKEHARTRVLTEEEIRIFWSALDGSGFDEVTADALRLQFLLGARIREITGMVRDELALKEAVPLWTLPASRAKGGRDVPRPLPRMALEIVRRRLAAAPDSRFVFASPFNSSQPIIPQAPTRAVKRAADRGLIPAGFTPHDLRRTCRTFWAKLGLSETVAKKLLGHAPPRTDVTAAVYDQYGYVVEMQTALLRWERHLARLLEVPASQRSLGAAA
jgi:integrase